MHALKIILYIILFCCNIWCAKDSFYEYANSLKTKTIINGTYFLVFIFSFVDDFRMYKAKQKSEDDI